MAEEKSAFPSNESISFEIYKISTFKLCMTFTIFTVLLFCLNVKQINAALDL